MHIQELPTSIYKSSVSSGIPRKGYICTDMQLLQPTDTLSLLNSGHVAAACFLLNITGLYPPS